MKSKNPTEAELLIQPERIELNLQEIGTERDATEETKNERERIGNDMLKEKLAGKKQDREERKKFGRHVFWLIVGYLTAIFVLLVLVGFGCMYMSDSVQLTLLGTFSANVLGLFWMVMNYLFSK
nr:MAG TPA: hypothetical protein [Caudoviricetes sp.]